MTFNEVLANFRQTSFTERNKGTRFERLIAAWFRTDPRFSEKLEKVWMWEDFPCRKDFGGKDIGIDLVAKTDMGDYWAIQCKCYDENAYIDKGQIDSFIAASGKTFLDEVTGASTKFAVRYWVSTSNNWSTTADEEIQNQDIPFKRITLSDLQDSLANGTMDSQRRSEILNWLSEDSDNPNECKVVANVSCLFFLCKSILHRKVLDKLYAHKQSVENLKGLF